MKQIGIVICNYNKKDIRRKPIDRIEFRINDYWQEQKLIFAVY